MVVTLIIALTLAATPAMDSSYFENGSFWPTPAPRNAENNTQWVAAFRE